MKKKSTIKTKKTAKTPKAKTRSRSGLRQSKSENFLEYIRSNNSMIEYITSLRVMNPAATADLNQPRREGSFTRLAHAREEFALPVFSKGKSVTPPQKKARRPRAKSRRKSV